MRASLVRLSPWGVARFIPLLAVLLNVLWVYPWLIWVSKWPALGWPEPPLTVWSATLLALAAEAITRFSLARDWPPGRVRLVVLSTLAVLLALVVRLELGNGYGLWEQGWWTYAQKHSSLLVGGLVFGVYLLWRGISIGRQTLSFDDLYRMFLIGLTALVVLLGASRVAGGSSALRGALTSTGLYVAAYFLVGLLALALINLQSLREEMLRHESVSGLLSRRWLSLLFGVVLAIVVVALGVASAFSLDLDLVTPLLRPLNVLANWLVIAFVYGVGYPLGVVALGLVYILRFLLQMVGRGQPPQPLSPPDVSGFLSDLRKAAEGQETGMPPEAALALKWGLVALVVVLVIFLLALTLFRYMKGKPEDEIEEVSESLWSWQGFKEDLRSFLARLLRWFRRWRPARPVIATPPIAASLQREDQDRLFNLREIYQGLLWEGRSMGFPRHPFETPYEYGSKLKGCVGPETSEVEAITEGYVAERYGGARVTGDRLERINTLWRRLRSVLRGDVERLMTNDKTKPVNEPPAARAGESDEAPTS